MHAHSQSYLVKELLLVFLGHYSADGWPFCLAFLNCWRWWLTLKIVCIMEMAHPCVELQVSGRRLATEHFSDLVCRRGPAFGPTLHLSTHRCVLCRQSALTAHKPTTHAVRPVTLSRAKQTEHRKHKQETQKSKKFLNRISSFSYPPSSDIGFTLVAPALVVRIFNQSRALIDDERERVYNPMATVSFML